MAARALMVDVDGVVVRRSGGRTWHADLEADLGIRPEDLDRVFFRAHFDDVLAGRADLFERLDDALTQLSATVPSRELVDYWFARDAMLDTRLLDDLAAAREAGYDAHLATVQEHHRARYLWHTLGLRHHFTAIHYAADLGHRKTDPAFYAAVEGRTGLRPARHCLVDDSEANVAAARAAGWAAYRWDATSVLDDVLAAFDRTGHR
ncbi:HAD family hydrolase [Puerhibacterium puerhi]|uniref:HAD family hydrolase n=1 Tax=Puerhibacterium puerhi TaxID=2692623 RepID=UPI00135C0C92|nr:HAD-IA family hydrolase [Puerhibacterium puerhi]